MVKIWSLCSRGSANIVEEGVPVSHMIVLHVRAGSWFFCRLDRDSSDFLSWAFRDSLWVTAQALRYSALYRAAFELGRQE